MTLTVAVTGHRPDKLGGYSDAVDARLIELACRFIERMRPAKVIVGMALGWDMAVADACVITGTPFIAAVPFQGQASTWRTDSKLRYLRLLRQASETVFVCEPGYDARKMQRRNEWMVRHGDHLVALWNGSEGGTGNCVAYAEKLRQPMTNLWPEWLELQQEQHP